MKQDNWPEVNKDLEDSPCINDLIAFLLHSSSSGGRLYPFLSRYVSLPCFCLQLFLCALFHLYCVSNNKFCTYFYSLCLLETLLLSNEGKSQGNFQPLLVSGQDSWFSSRLRILLFKILLLTAVSPISALETQKFCQCRQTMVPISEGGGQGGGNSWQCHLVVFTDQSSHKLKESH